MFFINKYEINSEFETGRHVINLIDALRKKRIKFILQKKNRCINNCYFLIN